MHKSFSDVAGEKLVEASTDVVVIGSGAGGGAIAAELAEGGRSVICVEEGGYYTARDYSLDPAVSIPLLYRNGGSAPILGTPNIIFSEGRCVGGSTVINGGMSWRTPEKILKRWEWELGIPELSARALDPYFTKVEERVSVRPQDPESIGEDANLMAAGAAKLGYDFIPAMRNQKHCAGANNCAFGCPTDAKQSVLLTYIPRLLASGGSVFSSCRIDKILTERGRAVGVEGRFVHAETGEKGPRCRIRARVVVVAAGAIQTPVLLLQNGLANSSGMVGRNFLCHPNAKVVGVFDRDVHAWKGVIQGNQIREFIDEGLMITTSMIPPGLVAMSLPHIGDELYEVMQDYRRMVVAGCLVEDTTTGRVTTDLFGEAKMRYDVCDRDHAMLIRGVALTSEILFAAGARRCLLPFDHLPSIGSADEINRLYEHPIPKDEIECLTVHAMGTAVLGRDPRHSVVDTWGETHDVKNLFIADASIFPGAIGVNPQVTIMALATRTGQYLLDNSARYFSASA